MSQVALPSRRANSRRHHGSTAQSILRRLLLSGAVVGLTGCDYSGAASDAEPAAALGDVLTVDAKLILEETSGVINVWPMARKDPRGGFLIADMREGAIRRYSADGKLHFTIGRTGDGPAEFRSPTAALRLPTGEILAITIQGKAAVIDSLGQQVLRTAQLPITSIEDAELLNDSLIVVSGTTTQELQSARLHLWDFRRDTLLASFFTPTVGNAIRDAATVAKWTNLAVRSDTIAAAFAPLDTIFLFTAEGAQIGKVPLRSQHFRLAAPMPEAVRRDRRARSEWVSSFHLVSGLEWVPSGFLVQYQGFENMTPYFNILRVNRSGELIFDVPNSPRFLLMVDTTTAYFADPDAETPNQWIVATLR